MNLELYNEMMKQKPSQLPLEWLVFLEFCEMYLKKNKIERPIVVELGSFRGRQKQFWEKLFNAEHIGIDISNRKSTPDIHGNTHDPETMRELKNRLNGRPINILFIDASHRYKNVKKDYKLYSPLCNDIIAIHDIELGRYQNIKTREVWKFWDELKSYMYKGEERYKNTLFLSIHQYRSVGDKSQTGIGVMIRNE